VIVPGMEASAASAHSESPSEVLRTGGLEVRIDSGMALADGRVLTLSVREFDLLVALARAAGTIVRREDLYREAWGAPLRNGDRSIDVYVHKLRVKLEQAMPGHTFIHTHIGFGYRLDQEPAAPSPLSPASHPLHNTDTSE
jgi:DNA-binding response OmpR family regulator